MPVVKSIWRNLRDQFRREFLLLRQPKYDKRVVWTYYEDMLFIQGNVSKQKSLLNENNDVINEYREDTDDMTLVKMEPNDSLNSSSTINSRSEENLECERIENLQDLTDMSIQYNEEEKRLMNITKDIENEEQNLVLVLNKISEKKRMLNDLKREIAELNENKTKTSYSKFFEESKNEDLQFFRSLISYMEFFTPLEKLEIRMKIQQLIFDKYSEKCLNEPPVQNQPICEQKDK